MALIDKIKAIADAIRDRTGSTGKMSLDEMAETISYMDVGSDDTQTYILVDENGVEYPAVLVDDPVTLTATANDIRLGTTAVTEEGVITGEKEIPSYHTLTGYRQIKSGSNFEIPYLDTMNMYDFTKLQVIICVYSNSVDESVVAEKVVIDENVYQVQSDVVISTVLKDGVNKKIDLGLINEKDYTCVLRYFMYKEII